MKCLIVDDDNFFRLIHTGMLSSFAECSTAVNGEEAVRMFLGALEDEQPYDFICMDIEMPVCNGHEALSQIRAIEKQRGIAAANQVKIIMLSTLNDPKVVMESYYKGVTSYIVKPVDESKLLQVLKNFKLLT